MTHFEVTDDNGNIKLYCLTSYEITRQDELSVCVKFNTIDDTIMYILRPDDVFKTLDSIEDSLKKILTKSTTTGNILQITEYYIRSYVTFSYETNTEFDSARFTVLA